MKNTCYDVMTRHQLVNLIKAEESRLENIDKTIKMLDDSYGKILCRWCKRKYETERKIADMKDAMKKKVSGSITIDFENVRAEDLVELYRHINRFTFSGGSIKYETTMK